MFFSQLTFDTVSLEAGRLARFLSEDSYQDHQLIWRLFPGQPDVQRNFLFRREQVNGWPCFYIVSEKEPQREDDLYCIKTKIYAPILRKGQILAFSVRVNPVVTRWLGEGEQRRQVRHDVVMDAKKSQHLGELPRTQRPIEAELAQTAGMSWLESRCVSWGFSVDRAAVRVDGYRQHRAYKKGRKRPIRFSTLDFTGLLKVDDPERLLQTLFQGIGKARGLGCGLLLVKPVKGG